MSVTLRADDDLGVVGDVDDLHGLLQAAES
jgi:hypothetical protein